MIGAPGQQPRLHILVPDVMAGLDLPVGLLNLRPQALLIGNVGFDGIGDEEIRAAARLLGQLREALFDARLEPDAEGRAGSVRHKHILALGPGNPDCHFRGHSISRGVCFASRWAPCLLAF